MNFLYEEILNGLSEIPATGSPGIIVVNGENAQAICTGDSPSNVFLAASLLGKGRVFVCAHDCYYKWFVEKIGGLEGDFINKVKIWLSKNESIDDSAIIEATKLKNDTNFSKYKIILWHGGKVISDQVFQNIREYTINGGGLFCAITLWGHLQINKKKTVKDIQMFNFLHDNVGIILTDKYFGCSKKCDANKNKAKFSNYRTAVDCVCENTNSISNFSEVITCCIKNMAYHEIHDLNAAKRMKESVLKQCEANGWSPIPSIKSPIKAPEIKEITRLLSTCLIELGEKAPNVEEFPFDFTELPELVSNVSLRLKSKFSERLSTGYYLPAGCEIFIRVVDGDEKGWKCRIGAHSDILKPESEYKRWPVCTVVQNLKPELNFKSPFGGLIYFECTANAELAVVMSNVVQSPYFDVTSPDYSNNWGINRMKPGLWAELAGNHIVLTVPSDCIRSLDDPRAIVDFWDNLVIQHHTCRGTDPNSQKRERVVSDKQASVGYMHSGYPIVTHLDVCEKKCNNCILDLEKMKSVGNWGLFHEIGHNMQRSEWTFEGCGEVTVNIFSMHAMEKIVGLPIIKQEFVSKQKKVFQKYFSKTPSYDDWKNNCGMALMTFAQLIRHFGWDSMYRFMSDYENDRQNDKNTLPKTNQDKIDQWVIRYSRIICRNIKPQFQLWGLPVSDSVDEHVNTFELFCPKEEIDAKIFFK